MPPSPLLSARIITNRYLMVMTQTIDHTMSDSMPSTFVGGQRDAVLGAERFLQRVERARADVAEDDADRADDQGGGGRGP